MKITKEQKELFLKFAVEIVQDVLQEVDPSNEELCRIMKNSCEFRSYIIRAVLNLSMDSLDDI